MQYYIAPLLMLIGLAAILYVDRADMKLGLRAVTPTAVIYGLFAIGAGIVITSSLIDLSAVGVSVLSAVIFTVVLSWSRTLASLVFLPDIVPIAMALLPTLVFAVASGCLVARCVVDLRAPPLIFTWAMGSIYIILAILCTDLAAPRFPHNVSGVNLESSTYIWFWTFGGPGFRLGLATLFVSMVIVNGINLPQRAAAIGAGEKSARYAGVAKRRTLYECFIASAIMASFAGLFEMTHLDSASTRDLVGKELIPIAIAVLGGTALSGGFINLPAIAAAAIFWSSVQALGPDLPRLFPWLKNESEVGQILLYVVFAVVVVWSGRYLTPSLPKIYARKE